MIDKKQVISHKLSKSPLDLSSRKKRILFLIFFGITFLLSSTITSAPDSKASEIQNKFKPTSDKSLDHSMLPSKTEGLNKGKEEYSNGEERGLWFQPPPYNVELVGMWPYGACNASAVDTTRNIALIGNGYALQVLDISTPSSLSKIGEVTLEGNAKDITISGNYAYVVTQSYLKIVDISDLNSPNEVGSEHFEGAAFERGGFHSVAFSSGYVYMAAFPYGGLFIYDVSDPNNPTRQAYYNRSITDVAIWGNYVICECEYYSPGPPEDWTYEIEVIDVSTPSDPRLTGTYQTEAGYGLSGIDVSDDGYVYSCQYSDTDETGKITVIDVATDPTSPTEVGSYVESGRSFEDITLSENYAYSYERWCCLIIMDISTPSSPSYVGEYEANWLYRDIDISGSFAGVSRSNGFSLFDVSDPSNPSQLGDYDTPDKAGSFNPIVVSGDYVYMACVLDGLRIMDISDPSNPTEAGICGDFHAGSGLAVSGRFAYCLHHGTLKIVDISSPNSPFLLASLYFPSDTDTSYEPCDIAVRENYAYVSGNTWISGEWGEGFLAVVDISNPLAPSTMGIYDCPVISRNGGISLSGNYAYLSFEEYPYVGVRRAGLRVIYISDPTDPTEVGYYFSSEEYTAITDSEGRYSYPVSDGWSGTAIPSKTDYAFSPSSRIYSNVTSDQVDEDYTATVVYINILPQLTSFAPQSTNISPQEISATGNHLSAALPTISGIVKTEGGIGIEGVTITFADASGDTCDDVAVRGNYAYLTGDSLRIIDISNPENPQEISSLHGRGGNVALSGDYAYLGNLRIVDISDPENPEDAGYYYVEGEGAGVAVSGNYAYLPGSLIILKNLLAPQISIIDPSAWETLYGPVSVEVLASHSSGIDRVEFYIDDELQSTDYTSPYVYAWDTTSVTDDPHKIRANAYNNNGKSSDSEIEVTVRNHRNLNIYSTSGGTTDPATGTYSYDYGTEVSITAIPESGYGFNGWTGDVPEGNENDNPVTITVDSDKIITANFITQYTLTIMAGEGGTTNPAPGSHIYNSGTPITVTATADTGYRFENWSGDVSSTDNSVEIIMNGDKIITANFIRQYTLTMAVGSGGTTDPSPGNYTWDEGTEVTIEATPDTGFRFNEWTGDVSSGHENDNPLALTMDSDKSITANFGLIPQYTLTIIAGEGGTTDPDPGDHNYNSGASVNVTAIADTGYRFGNWSGDVSSTDYSVEIIMNGDKIITANFIRQHTLILSAGAGGTTDPSPGTYTHDSGTNVALRAIASSGYVFGGWSGDVSGTDNPITIAMDSDKSIIASFSKTDGGGGTGGDGDSGKKSPCFIATAAYGSPLHPHIDVLRDFRDKYLMPSKLGRMMVECYYRHSPSVADFIAKHKALKVVFQISLLPLVAFAYSFIHFGPIIATVMPLFIFGLPIFLNLFFRRKTKQKGKEERS